MSDVDEGTDTADEASDVDSTDEPTVAASADEAGSEPSGEAGDAVPSAVQVLEFLVKSVVDDPAAVNVEVDERGRRPAFNVTVGDGDMGRVIGKRGRVAQSIRTVTRAAASRDQLEIDIEFLD